MREIESIEEFDNLCLSTASVDKILVVDFFAPWCRPCSRVAPLYEKLSYRYHYSDVTFVKVNVDVCTDLTFREHISSLPTFKIYKDGSCIGTFTGMALDLVEKALDEAYLDEPVKELLSSPPSPLVQKAKSKLLSIANIAALKIASGKSFEISLSDPVFERYFLVIPGCMQFLFSMGFQEQTESLILPENSSRRRINRLIRQLRGPPPPRVSPATNSLLSTLENYRREVALYAKPAYQKLARKAVPLDQLLLEAAESAATTVLNVKPTDLLRTLVRWYKDDFFSWVKDRICDKCGSTMNSKPGEPTEVESTEGLAHTVEVYVCPSSAKHPCKRFPRFNNPVKLLQTREGRCGEWAECFSFILASLRKKIQGGQEKGKKKNDEEDDSRGEPWFPGVRLIYDVTDHVFCEVWLTDLEDPDEQRAVLSAEGRWVHVDPCEGLIDVPLVYEQGWKKKLSYMFAFTVPPPIDDSLLRYEAVDVTDIVWKYSTDFKGICRRRKRVGESELALYLAQVHDEAAQAIPESAVAPFGLPTTIQELAVMMVPPRPSLASYQGRKSGTEAWRRSRGEFSQFQSKWEGSGYTIHPTATELSQGCIYLRYSCSMDGYARPYSQEIAEVASENSEASPMRSTAGPRYLREIYLKNWSSMCLRWRNIARKVERDWKMVYLARKEGCHSYEDGVIEWLIDLSNTKHSVKTVTLFATMAVFEERSKVTLEVTTDTSKSRSLTLGSAPLSACADFEGAKQLRLTARLWNELENNDSNVWQKAQIFRQKETDNETWPLELKVTLKPDDGAKKVDKTKK